MTHTRSQVHGTCQPKGPPGRGGQRWAQCGGGGGRRGTPVGSPRQVSGLSCGCAGMVAGFTPRVGENGRGGGISQLAPAASPSVDTLHLQFHRRKRQQVRNAQAPCQCTYFSPGFSGERSLDAHQLFVPEKWCPQRTIPQEPDLSPTQAQQTLKINKIVAGGVRWTRGDTSGSEPAAGAMHRYHKLPWWWSPGGCVRWHCM